MRNGGKTPHVLTLMYITRPLYRRFTSAGHGTGLDATDKTKVTIPIQKRTPIP